jgi:glycosyltransferase involved in cell wall biosynthesis
LKEKGWINLSGGKIDPSQVYYINNGVNLSTFNTDIIDNPLNDIDLDDPHFFNVIYLGSIRLVNNLKELVDAAKLLISFQRVRILIYGDGPDRDYLEEYCIKNHITNVHFKEKWISFKNVPSVLSRSSLNILNYQKDFGKYGISSGKFFQYLAAGKPICSNIKMNYCLIEKYNLGIAKKLETAKEYADAILKLASLDEDSYKSMCDRVKSISKDFDYKILSSKLIEVIES